MQRNYRIVTITAIAVALATAQRTEAQEVRFSALQAAPDHPLLGKPAGFGVEIGIQPLRLLGVRAGYEQYGDDFSSVGSTCVGLVFPGENCSDEPRSDAVQMRAFTFSVPLTLVATDWLRLNLLPGLRTVKVESDQVGMRSGRRRSAAKSISGGQLGLETVVLPFQEWPVRLHLAVHGAFLNRYDDYLVIDGYSPFERDIQMAWIQIGLSLTR